MEDTYNSVTGYLGKICGTQSMEERHQTFSGLVMKGKLRKAIQFVCEREKEGVFQPGKLAADSTGTINETVTSELERINPIETITSCTTLEMYEETPIFIPVNIKEEAI